MNNVLFQQARQAYNANDYVSALEGFTQCLQGANNGEELAAGEAGLLYHQIGNCLMKLHDYDEAFMPTPRPRPTTPMTASVRSTATWATAMRPCTITKTR